MNVIFEVPGRMVFLPVRAKSRPLTEAGITSLEGAHVWLLHGVCVQVLLKVHLMRKLLVAHVAQKPFLVEMHACDMPLKAELGRQ